MKITRDILLHTADLARLDLSVLGEEALQALTEQLDAIVHHVAQLESIDTTDVPATTHAVPLPTAFREDRVVAGPSRESLLANAPEAEDGYFVVPRVIAAEADDA